MRKLQSVVVSWSRRHWNGGERCEQGLTFSLDREKGLQIHGSGALTQGSYTYCDVPVEDVVGQLELMREHVVEDSGVVVVLLQWQDAPDDVVYRKGVFSQSIRDERDDKRERTNSQAANLIVEYLDEGNEDALRVLSDYLKDKFPRSV